MAYDIKKVLSLNIARKVLFGYLVLSAFTIVLGVYFLSSLNTINSINRSIIETDTEITATTELAIEILLSQESHGRKFVILKTPEGRKFFWERSVEFRQMMDKLKELPDIDPSVVHQITDLHSSYTESFNVSFEVLMKPGTSRAAEADEDIRGKHKKLIYMLRAISNKANGSKDRKTLQSARMGRNAFRISIVLCSLALLTGISAAAIVTRGISESITILKSATQKIATGVFDDIPLVNRNDELGELSVALGDMAVRIKHLEEMYLDASPLTHLPGGIAIENVLKKRISTGDPMAFCLLDMDNFKAFNDYYGYAKGSDLIVATANLIESTVKEIGRDDDFVGHIGGDDFALITEPSTVPDLCKAVIERFDREARGFYDPEAREKGYIVAETRQGEEAKFPIVTISIAVVTNQNRKLVSHLEMGEIAAELKEYAKSISGSIYVIDHRRKNNR